MKKIFLSKYILRTLGFMMLGAAVAMAGTAQRWIHVRVESARGASSNVSFNVPIEMASTILPNIPANPRDHSKFNIQASVNGMDLRAMLDAVRNSPDNVFISMERNNKEVSVAKSGGNLLIKVANKPGPEHHVGETVSVKVPIPVVRAMLAGNSDDLDIGAGIRAISRYGDVQFTITNEKETVRVWTDTHTATD